MEVGRTASDLYGSLIAYSYAAMLFFQTVLIAGYVYAHLLIRYVPPRWQLYIHLAFWALALSFLVLVGMALIAEGIDLHIPKGYIYFAMAFSFLVEMLNIRLRRKELQPVKHWATAGCLRIRWVLTMCMMSFLQVHP